MKCSVSVAAFLALCGTTMHAQATGDSTRELAAFPDAPRIGEGANGSEVAQDKNSNLSMAAGSRQLGAKAPTPKDTPSPKKKSPKKSGKISAAALARKRARKAARIAARRRARIAARRAARRAARIAARRAARRGVKKNVHVAPTPGWIPAVGQTWNHDLGFPVATDADVHVMVIDLDAEQEDINTLHKQGQAVVCYISIGTVEVWRDDAHKFPDEAVGNFLEGVEDECWIDINHRKIRHIMRKRVQRAASMNCDAILPGSMMNYAEEDTGLSISKSEQIEYNLWFTELVRHHGMLVGIKDALELVPLCHDDFDFAVNFSCFEDDECDVYLYTFIKHGKPVFNAEFDATLDHCDDANDLYIDSIVKDVNLPAPFCSCAHPDDGLHCSAVLGDDSESDDGTEGGGSCADFGGGPSSGSVCCPAECGQCGGSGCGTAGEGCCASDATELCSDCGAPPCLLDD